MDVMMTSGTLRERGVEGSMARSVVVAAEAVMPWVGTVGVPVTTVVVEVEGRASEMMVVYEVDVMVSSSLKVDLKDGL
jgi:hypothetical protein